MFNFESMGLLLICYVIGTIPFGLLLTKFFAKKDIRTMGSGNIGATNVLRNASKLLALGTLLGDLGKGSAAVYLAHVWMPSFETMAALAVLIGHIFPLWLKFRGGKGVATYAGVMVVLYPFVALGALLVWGMTFYFTRMSSLSALLATALAPVPVFVMMGEAQGMFVCLMSALIWWTHRDNIKRLLTGKEHRFK